MRLSAFIIIFTLVYLLACAGDARCEELPAVKSIEFIGLKRIPEGAVRAKIAHRAGEPLNTGRVSDDVKAVYQMGYFEDVRVQAEPFEGGIKLIFAIKEKPYVTRVDFRGNEEIDDTKLRETITITPGSSADIVAVKENADKVYRLYEKEGYPLALVVPVISRISEDSIFLTYQIEEGRKVKIRDITIKGNKALSTRTVRGAMKTSERWMLSFLTGGGRYEEEQLRSDIEAIRELYLNGGYMRAEVFPPVTEFSPNKKQIDITVEVREGEQYTVSSIEFRGNAAFTEEELMKKVKSQVGSLVSMKALRADVAALTEMYTEKGHALADIYPDFIPEEEAGKLKVVFVVREGDVYSIGRISISGNLKTRDKVIRRELLLNEGNNFNSRLLRRSHQKIYNLNMFEALDFKPFYDPAKKTMDIDVEVKERPTGSVSIGGGYSSVDKFIGMVEITEGNLGGRGQYLKLKGEFSSRSTTYELSFRDPWFLDYPVSFTTSVYNTRREYINYEKRATGFTLGFGKRFLDYWGTNLTYNFERSTIYDVQATASTGIKEQEGTRTTSSISPSLTRDTRDNFLDPHTGSQNGVYLTYAGMGGSNKFFKSIAESIWYFPVSEMTTFSVRGNYGYAAGLYGEKLPLYERFYVGGMYSLRGLGFGEAGPKDENGVVTGGTKKVIFNAEYTFPLVPAARLKGVMFYDIGTSYDDNSDIRFRKTAGGGIRWISPIGPLRLEWGRNLDRRPGETEGRWEFTFGTFF